MGSIDEEQIIKDVLTKYSRSISQIYARQIADGVRRALLAKQDKIVAEAVKSTLSSLVKTIVHHIILATTEAVEATLRENADIIANQVRLIVSNELKRLRNQIEKEIIASATKSASLPAGRADVESQLIKLSNDLRECKMRLAEVSSKLATLFNVMLKFEPRLHAIPILEEAGQISIDRLAAMLRTPIHRVVEFLRVLEDAGIVRIHGNTVRLAYPIFRSPYEKKK